VTTTAVLAAALLALTALVVALAASIAARRTLRRRRLARQRRRADPVRPLLLALAAGELDEQLEAQAALAALDPAAWRAVEPSVVALLGKVRGESLLAVVELLDERGLLARAGRDLLARSAVRRARAAELLGAAGQRAAVPALVALLDDRDAEVRLVAARALGRISLPGAAGPLLASLGGASPLVPVPVVAHALLRIGSAGAGAVRRGLDAPAPLVRTTAAEVLGRLGAVAAVEGLCALLARDPVPGVRASAATALGRLGAPAALAALVGATAAPEPAAVRLAAARALGEVGAPRALDHLATLVADADDRVAAAATTALGGRAVPAAPAPAVAAPAVAAPAAPAPAVLAGARS
jgi:HEAT repeat protein